MATIELHDIEAAAARIAGRVHRTTVLSSEQLNAATGADIRLKCENFQKVGAFKARGATNALLGRDRESLANGVVCHSSGNHAQAVAYAAKLEGVPAYIVMPSTAPEIKVAAVRQYGGQIVFSEPNERSRNELASAIAQEKGATFIHPFNDPLVIAGQGTVGLEILESTAAFDTVVVPLGGGGLISGIATAVKSIRPSVKIIGVEPEGAADTVLSLRRGERTPLSAPASIADGLLTTVGELTFPIIQQLVDEVVAVSDDEIRAAMKFLGERMKLVVEPSGAVGIAALLQQRIDVRDRSVVVVISGGNRELLI